MKHSGASCLTDDFGELPDRSVLLNNTVPR
jgi:hypothetical protein